MKRVLFALLLVVAFATSAVGHAALSSVVQLRDPVDGQAYCSGFVINVEKQLVATADHCMNTPALPIIDGKPAFEVFHDQTQDYAVLFVPALDLSRPALKPVTRSLIYNEPVTLLGFVREEAQAIAAKVWVKELIIRDMDNAWSIGPVVAFTEPAKGGMSGGPIVDFEGKVVGIVQSGWDEPGVAISVPVPVMLEALKEVWIP